MSCQPRSRYNLRVAELFAGIGGFGRAFELHGHELVYSNEWSKYAADIYDKHFEKKIDRRDITTVPASDIPPHDILVGGFPCFAAGTLITTECGFVPIEEVTVGTKVLTHTGSWKPVLRRMETSKPVQKVKAQMSLSTSVTDEHPYYVRKHARKWDADLKRNVRSFSDPIWLPCGELDEHFGLSPVSTRSVRSNYTNDELWIIGRWFADGWVVNRKDRGNGGPGRVVFGIGKAKADQFRQRLLGVFPFCEAEERTVVKFHICNASLARILSTFGRQANEKDFGEFIHLPHDQAIHLLSGYFSGDGHSRGTTRYAVTTSHRLALGIAYLCMRVYGIVPSISEVNPPNTKIVEGRVVKQRPWFRVAINLSNHAAFLDDCGGWARIARKTNDDLRPTTVYNLEVEEDNSYVANGLTVHNCQAFSIAGKRRGFDEARGTLFFDVARILEHHRPRTVLLENVKGLLSHDKGNTFAIICETLDELGYDLEWQVLNGLWAGVPQHRERVFIVGHLRGRRRPEIFPIFPSSCACDAQLASTAIDANYCKGIDNHGQRTAIVYTIPRGYHDGIVHIEKSPTVSSHSWEYNNLLLKVPNTVGIVSEVERPKGNYLPRERVLDVDGPRRAVTTSENQAPWYLVEGQIRRLTPLECERLFGFPDDWTKYGVNGLIPDTQRYKCLGNSVVVPLVEEIVRRLSDG